MFPFRQLPPDELHQITSSIDDETYHVAGQIVADVQAEGEAAVRRYAAKFDGLSEDATLVQHRPDLLNALQTVDVDIRSLLQRTADRIRRFAEIQLATLTDCSVDIPGGSVGHRWIPLRAAGCYAPGGRYPLPSSVLMTAVTARVAGVREVWVASPRPDAVTLAAAAIADADGLISVGGAQAIAAMSTGLDSGLPKCDVIVGPGNRFVTAAKALVARSTRIDMLAGPSELVVVASADADAGFVAADLLAQAEHDVDARPILITNSSALVDAVTAELEKQLSDLPTAEVARTALQSGGYVVVDGLEQAVECCRRIAPEHLSLQGAEFEAVAETFDMGAALFVGSYAAEVLGDYGAGPNHVLPTGGAACANSPLSVATFLRMQTQLQIDDPVAAAGLATDAEAMGRLEGLAAHARSVERRFQHCRQDA